MPRIYKDLLVNEPDGKPRFRLKDLNGNTVLEDVSIELSSEILQEGDQFGALAANRTLRLDEDGTPLLHVDGGTFEEKPGEILLARQGEGESLPAACEYGEPLVLQDGSMFVGNSQGVPVPIAPKAYVKAVEDALQQFIARRDNPHVVTRAQLGAAAATDLQSHSSNRDNPHRVTAAQVGALPYNASTGRISSKVVLGGGLTVQSSTVQINMHSTNDNLTGGIRLGMTGTMVLMLPDNADAASSNIMVRTMRSDGSLGSYKAVEASAFTVASDASLKTEIKSVDDAYAKALLRVAVAEYSYKGEQSDQQAHIGAVADEVEKVAPIFVSRDAEGIRSLNVSEMTFALLRLVQLQEERISALEAQTKKKGALKQRLAGLRKKDAS